MNRITTIIPTKQITSQANNPNKLENSIKVSAKLVDNELEKQNQNHNELIEKKFERKNISVKNESQTTSSNSNVVNLNNFVDKQLQEDTNIEEIFLNVDNLVDSTIKPTKFINETNKLENDHQTNMKLNESHKTISIEKQNNSSIYIYYYQYSIS